MKPIEVLFYPKDSFFQGPMALFQRRGNLIRLFSVEVKSKWGRCTNYENCTPLRLDIARAALHTFGFSLIEIPEEVSV